MSALVLFVAGCRDEPAPQAAESKTSGTSQSVVGVTNSPPESALDQIALFQGAPTTRLRGRVLDSVTAQPAARVWVRMQHEEQAWLTRATDTGHFIAPGALPDGPIHVSVGLDEAGPFAAALTPIVEHDSAQAAATLQVLRVPLGPSYQLEFLDAANDQPERWEGRVIERNARGTYRDWSWQVLRTGALPRLVYLRAEHPVDSNFATFVEVRLRERDWFARSPVASTRGTRPEPLHMTLVQYGAFGGQLIDAAGEAVARAAITLIQESGSEDAPMFYDGLRTTWSAVDGQFRFPALFEPGGYHMRVQSEGRDDVVLELQLKSAGTEGYQLILSALHNAEELPVAIIGAVETDSPGAVVSLRSIDGGQVRRALHTRLYEPVQGFVEIVGSGCAMLFTELPRGRFELAVFGVDGQRYEPARMEMELPLEVQGLALTSVALPARELRFDVRESGTRRVLPRHHVLLTGDRWWFPPAPSLAAGEIAGSVVRGGSASRWMVFVPGYRPAYGSLEDLPQASTKPVELDLEPGWGCEILFRDASRGLPRPDLDSWQLAAHVFQAEALAGVTVFADGVAIGTSDADGRVHLALRQTPRQLEFQKPGWRVIDARAAGGEGGDEAAALGQVGSAVLWFTPYASGALHDSAQK